VSLHVESATSVTQLPVLTLREHSATRLAQTAAELRFGKYGGLFAT
jgi:hypothetical protein